MCATEGCTCERNVVVDHQKVPIEVSEYQIVHMRKEVHVYMYIYVIQVCIYIYVQLYMNV